VAEELLDGDQVPRGQRHERTFAGCGGGLCTLRVWRSGDAFDRDTATVAMPMAHRVAGLLAFRRS
jgi:hypothetical protein